jgi:hypothetical protein
MITENDFDWSVTERDIVIVLPSVGRKVQLIPGLKRLITTTALPKENWRIVVMNNCCHEDLSDLQCLNCSYFTLSKSLQTNYLNGGYARNYVLKRLRSKRVIFRDAEIFHDGDYLSYANQLPVDAVGELFAANQVYYNGIVGGVSVTASPEVTRAIIDNPMVDLRTIARIFRMRSYEGMNGYGWIAPTKMLQDMRGFDEDFDEWGMEDSDIFDRIKASGRPVIRMPQGYPVYATHLFHPPAPFPSGKACRIYKEKDPNQLIRNPNGWGEWKTCD